MQADKPHYHGHRQRLRERFLKSGLDGFADHEVVELLLTLAIPRADVKPQAKALLSRFGSLRGILDAPLAELRDVQGIGSVAPIALQVIKATAALYLLQTAEGRQYLGKPEDLERYWRLRIGASPNEVFEVGYLDSGYHLLHDGLERLSEGTIDKAAVYPRRVVESALRKGAYGLVLAHNHPSGSVAPTEQDKVLTRAIVLASEAVGIRVVEHLIVSPDEVFSFRKAGLL